MLASPSFGQDVESRLKTLEDITKAQQQKIEEQQRLIVDLKSSSGEASAPDAAGTAARPTPGEPGQAATPGQEGTTAKVTGIFGGSAMTNPYISLIVNTFFYGSNLKQTELDSRTIPGFTNVPARTSARGSTSNPPNCSSSRPSTRTSTFTPTSPSPKSGDGTGGSLFRYFLPARRPSGQGREVQERLRPHQRPASPCMGFRRRTSQLPGVHGDGRDGRGKRASR